MIDTRLCSWVQTPWNASGRPQLALGSTSAPYSSLVLEQPCFCCSWADLQLSRVCHTACVHRKQQTMSFAITAKEDCVVVLPFSPWSLCNRGCLLQKSTVSKAFCAALASSLGSFWVSGNCCQHAQVRMLRHC